MIKVKGFFSDWIIQEYHAEKGDYSIKLPISFMFFDDTGAGKQTLLKGMPWLLKRRLWRELKREQKRRAIKKVNELSKK